MDLASVLGQAEPPGLLKAELVLNYPGGMLTFGPDMSFDRLDPIPQPSLWNVRQGPALAGVHCYIDFVASPAILDILAMPW